MDYTSKKSVLKDQYNFITEATEFRMALWINGFGLLDNDSGEELIPMIHSFNLEQFEEYEYHLKIRFRIYPHGLKYYEVEIYPGEKLYRYEGKVYGLQNFAEFFVAEEDVLRKFNGIAVKNYNIHK